MKWGVSAISPRNFKNKTTHFLELYEVYPSADSTFYNRAWHEPCKCNV